MQRQCSHNGEREQVRIRRKKKRKSQPKLIATKVGNAKPCCYCLVSMQIEASQIDLGGAQVQVHRAGRCRKA
jgi:hypothetical protein